MARRKRQPSTIDTLDHLVKMVTGKTISQHARTVWEQLLEPELRRFLENQAGVSCPPASQVLADARYALLEVDPSCSNEVLKAAYHARARQLHPDMKGGDETAFKRLQEAYEAVCRERGIKP